LVLRSGDAIPPQGDDLTSINFTLQIPPLPEARMVYLQIRSTSARVLNVQVQPYAQAQQLNRMQEWLVGFVVAASGIFAVWALVQWWATREALIGLFALKQVAATVWAFFLIGFARLVIGPGLPEGLLSSIASVAGVSTLCTTLWFLQALLKPYQPSWFWHKALQVTVMFSATLLLLEVLEQTRLMLFLTNSALLLAFAIIFICVLTALPRRIKQPIPLWVLLVYFLLYIPLNSLPAMIALGWIDARPIVLYGHLGHTVLDGFVMFVLLQIRSHALRQEREQITLSFQRSQQQTEDEKRHREEQSQLFAMLAHEMKTPLATLRMWMQAGQLKPETMERAIADMNQVIERCVHTGQLADQGLTPEWALVDPLMLTRQCIPSCRDPSLVDLQAPETTEPLRTDAQMLSIVLGNLLDNACKYSPPDSRIHVQLLRAEHDGQAGWLWQVRNRVGPAGLPDTDRLFDKYYRSPGARRLTGSGLGLFLVKGLLNLLQGQIAYEALDDHVLFSVWLPAQPSAR
jgi:signal transduction histidine kinase